jgi:hypothetical protein
MCPSEPATGNGRRQLNNEISDDRGPHYGCFLNRKAGTDAGPPSDAERETGEAVNGIARIAEESRRIKGVGFFPDRAVAMQDIWRNDHRRAAEDRHASKPAGGQNSAKNSSTMNSASPDTQQLLLNEQTGLRPSSNTHNVGFGTPEPAAISAIFQVYVTANHRNFRCPRA